MYGEAMASTAMQRPVPLACRNRSGFRFCALSLGGQEHEAPVYDWDGLTGRAAVSGPAVAVGATMTCLVPPGWSLSIDEFANGALRRGA